MSSHAEIRAVIQILMVACASAALACMSGCGRQGSVEKVDDALLADADKWSSDWLTHGRTYDEQRFSPLRQIDEGNVTRLGLKWSIELGTSRGMEATPLVTNEVLYTTGAWSVVYAIDAASGRMLWTFDPHVNRARARVICCDAVNRGVAIYKGKVYVGTLDGRLIALDAKSGKVQWETATTDATKPYSITGAPRIANGMVVIGNGGAEMGVRGYVSAYDAKRGSLVWRTYTVPGDPSQGFESEALKRAATTWSGKWWQGGGGGTVWDAIVYDPELRLVYVGTGNGSPWYRDLRSPGGGDNLYLSSILALRVDDGEQAWHFQTTPGDHWDYTATQPLMLASLTIEGRTRRVIMQAPKNGFFYVIDRATGQLISAKPFARINWATGLDEVTGRPIESKTAYAGMNPVLVSPDPSGAHGWHPMAFNPQTGLVYLPVRDQTTFLHRPDAAWQPATTRRNEGLDASYSGPMLRDWLSAPPPIGRLVAWDPVSQSAKWTIDHPVLMAGGVLATAGNLVIQGRSDGMLLAYRAADGGKLWEFDAGTGIMAPPISYLVGGKQYLTLMVGWGGGDGLINPPGSGATRPGYARILTFALDGNARLNATPFRTAGVPHVESAPNATATTVDQGRVLYDTFCYSCHGIAAVAGSLPDLRYATPETLRRFADIVLKGERQALGMPSFGDLLNDEQVSAIKAYVIARAKESQQSQ